MPPRKARRGAAAARLSPARGAHIVARMKTPALVLSLALVFAAAAATVPDRERAVRNDRATMEKGTRWIYNDVGAGFAEAKKTGKPLLVVLRCVPCMSCMGIDQEVTAESPELAKLHERFVCVRVINANALDLARFQFDYDLSFSTLFFNADGTIYGRYGSWKHQRDPQEKTTAGYQRALEAVLAIHAAYPANRSTLASKQGVAMPFSTPVEIPALSLKYKVSLDWEGKVVQSCVHCHMVGDAIRASYRSKGERIPEQWIFPQPAPETIGITLAPDAAATIDAVAAGSIAERSGASVGDRIVSLAGAPVVSAADVSWALHCAPGAGPLSAVLKRAGAAKEIAVALDLPAGWRSTSDISKRVGTWGLRRMTLNSLKLRDLADGERAQRGLPMEGLALELETSGYMPAAAKNAGFQKDDVIVEIDGRSARATESEMIGSLLAKHGPGDKLKTVVLRGGQRLALSMTMQ